MKSLFFLITTLTCYSLCAADRPVGKNHKHVYAKSEAYVDEEIADNSDQDENETTSDDSDQTSEEYTEEETESTTEETTDDEIADAMQPQNTSLTPLELNQGDRPLGNKAAHYNPTAQVHLDQDHAVFATVSYLYWNAEQDGMDLATTGSNVISNGNPTVVKTGVKGKTITQDFPYNSGYKVGLGYNFENTDEWTLRADLTGLYQTNHTSHSAPTSTTGVGVLALTNWFYQASAVNQNPACTHLSSRWHLGLNWFDLSVSRAFYQGSKFTVSPFGGIRNSWISQSVKINIDDTVNFPDAPDSHSHNKLSSWGIGPRVGIDGRFLLGAGWRLQGNVGASLLFTKYGTLSHSEAPLLDGGSTVSYNMNNYTCLRSMFETNLGLGWGTYLSHNRYHLDLSATYDFNYMWNQNMLRTLNEINIIGNSGGGLDLSLQGLTISAYFHF